MSHVKDSEIASQHNKLLHMLPIEICRCLGGCDRWFRSTDKRSHRICNECKGLAEHESRIWANGLAYWRGGQPLDNGARQE